MDKTLGQIALSAAEKAGGWVWAWEAMPDHERAEWEAIAAAVAAAVKEEDARICEGERVDEDGRGTAIAYNLAIYHCAAAIRASIKEVK